MGWGGGGGGWGGGKDVKSFHLNLTLSLCGMRLPIIQYTKLRCDQYVVIARTHDMTVVTLKVVDPGSGD